MKRIMVIALCASLAACGVKGPLKTPDQVQAQREKEARKAEKEATRREQQQPKRMVGDPLTPPPHYTPDAQTPGQEAR